MRTIQHKFSKRWKSEYLVEMQRRYKWKTSKNNLKENDFVMIKTTYRPQNGDWVVLLK